MPTLLTLTFSVVSDLYETSVFDEDGARYIGLAHYIVAEAPDGSRWTHDYTFRSECRSDNAWALQQANRLLARILTSPLAQESSGRALNGHWSAIQPCYGSYAYQKNWRAYAASDELADGNYEAGSSREYELRALSAP
jgi:hypothetical protein